MLSFLALAQSRPQYAAETATATTRISVERFQEFLKALQQRAVHHLASIALGIPATSMFQ